MTDPTTPVGPAPLAQPPRPLPVIRPQHWLWARPVRADGLNDDAPPRPPLFRDTARFNLAIRLVAFLGTFIVLSMSLGVAMYLAGVNLTELPGAYVPNAIMLIVAAVGSYLPVVLLLEGRRPPVELSLRRFGGLFVGLALGALLISLVVGIQFLLGAYKVDGTQTPRDLAMIFLVAGLQAAVFEEILFRGIVFRYLEEFLGTWAALAISALLFGLVHITNENSSLIASLAIALEAGVLFAAVYVVTRSLWACIGLHYAWNVVQAFVFGVPVSGNQVTGWLRSRPAGPEWLSGGAFGAEQSVIAIVLLTALAIYLLVRAHRNRQIVAPFWVRRARARTVTEPASAELSPA